MRTASAETAGSSTFQFLAGALFTLKSFTSSRTFKSEACSYEKLEDTSALLPSAGADSEELATEGDSPTFVTATETIIKTANINAWICVFIVPDFGFPVFHRRR